MSIPGTYIAEVCYWAIESYFSFPTDFDTSKHIVDLLLGRHDILVDEADKEALEKFKTEESLLKSVFYVPGVPFGMRALPWW